MGVDDPFLARQAFDNFACKGAYPDPAALLQFRLGYVKRKFPNTYAEESSLEVQPVLRYGASLFTRKQ